MTPDNDKNSAVQKVVDAFRARRAGESDPAAAEPTDTPDTPDTGADGDAAAPAETSVIKIEPGQTPGGGDSESPTKAFAIPAAAAAAAAAAAGQDTEETPLPEVDGDEDPEDEAAEPESDDATEEAPAEEAPATEDPADEAPADDEADDEATTDEAAADEAPADDPATDERETTVVAIPGTGERAETPARRDVESVDPDADPRGPIVEHPIELGETEADADAASDEAASDESATEIIDAAAVSAAANAAAPTEQIAVPDDVAAAAAAETKPAEQAWSTSAHQPEVIAPATTDEPKKGRAGLWAAIVVALVIVAAVLIWFFGFNESEQDKVADAAETYQTAMADGDLEALKAITCGEQYAIYADMSPEEFTQAYESQKSRNQMMLFKDVNAVAIDGDTARVGVDVYSTDDPNTTTSAQVTLSKVNGEWKVCAKP
ncbi:DUF4878 domain-containing protein [Gordonia alkaliphila]|uniref:Rv0361 family membrane protein n=1 Tax=Gordonia alkaliphila TaxID=1053547 RepID=UPI001FF63755|nr:DUF4878 domain-containing protein [Gordonia alkaliphila]MCK0439417.1 DUF4878 domain-containing protein [Gordonia alkaliphila]